MKARKTREERLAEIRTAAGQVFYEKGFHYTTMEDIIERTDLSKGGFYHYYSSTKEILSDLMQDGSFRYMQFNPFFKRLEETRSKEASVDIILEAFLEKCLVVTPDRKVYAMFALEALYDPRLSDEFDQLERDFFEFLCDKFGLDMDEKYDEMQFISRLMNSIQISQNIFNRPEILEKNREKIKAIVKPLLEDLIK